MGGLTLNYVVRRFAIFLITVWAAATIIFIIPRLAPGDPIQGMISQLSAQQGAIEGSEKIIEAWRERFGLNDPVHIQYIRYFGNILRFDFGPSLALFPTSVSELISRALPWSIGLGLCTVSLTFLIGNFLGAVLAWNKTPRAVKSIIPATMIFTSLPSVLAAILFIYVFAFILKWFPLQAPYARGVEPGLNLEFIGSVIHHGVLPVASIVVVSFGYWALGMRGMMITTEGEDYMTLAEAKGMRPFYVLYRYQVRNAILPQVTALALGLGTLVGGQILVEAVFAYRGMGTVIFRAIRGQDFNVIQGSVILVVLITALGALIIDLIYPLIDPRISLEGR
jgi:peptide/nickel transport system permease protein